jgi:Holliday junction resolvasome RuvABC DNA-binding subunit
LQDKAMIGRANGVGKKLAERIVLELKDKAPAYTAADVGLSQVAADLAAPKIHRCQRCRLGAGQSGLRADAGCAGGFGGAEEGRR